MKLRRAGIASAESVIGDVDMKFQQSILWFLETPTFQIMDFNFDHKDLISGIYMKSLCEAAAAESVIGDVDMKFQQSILWFL